MNHGETTGVKFCAGETIVARVCAGDTTGARVSRRATDGDTACVGETIGKGYVQEILQRRDR